VKKIDIKGRIIPQSSRWIYNLLGIPATSPQDISSALLEANGDDIEIYVNSGGGSVYDGYEIYNLVREYSGNVTFKVIGLAASAASFICMASNCMMSPLAQMMIHNASSYAEGPHQSLDEASNMLQVTDHTIATAYVLKSGKNEDEIRNLMENETWLSAEDCKNLGLIDEIMFGEGFSNNINTTPTLYNAISDDTLMSELEKCHNVNELKKKLTENIDKIFQEANSPIPGPTNEVTDTNILENNNKEAKEMDLGTLKNEHKDVYDQVVNEATKNERERIKAIEDLAIPGNEDIINKAKFETGVTAENVAVEIIKAQKQKGLNYIDNAQKDAENAKLNQVNNVSADNKTEEDCKKEAVNLLVDAAKGLGR
jgi:ATP-dependent Clp endopeptidase proteolytic subunit ClpP